MQPLLIGGAPCAGKTTLAKAIATTRGVAVGQVDDLRNEFQQAVAGQIQHYPWLLSSHNISAEDFWKNRRPADLVTMEIEQAREYWPTLKDIIASNRFGVLEGVSILPELVWRDFGPSMPAIFMIDADRDRVWDTITKRGLWGEANSYADWIKPLELEWVMLHNEWSREQEKKYPYSLIEVQDRDATFGHVIKILNSGPHDA